MGGAGLLFVTNLVAIVSSAFLVFLLIGMNAHELAAQIEKCREGEPLAERMRQGTAAQVLMHTGRLRWRFLVLIVLLGAVSVPLKKAFVEVTGEAVARSAVQQVVKELLPSGALVSQQVDVEPNSISVRLFSTKQVSIERQKEAEQAIQKRSGRTTAITIASVASQSELSQMMERLTAVSASPPLPAAPPPETIDQLQANLLQQISPVLTSVWPTEAPLSTFDVTLGDNGVTLDAQYESDRELSSIALGMITKQLREKLNLPNLTLNARRMRVPRKSTSRRGPQTR
jgi:uncharacterized membrane protein